MVPLGVARGVDARDVPAREEVVHLAHAEPRHVRVGQAVQQRRAGRRQADVLPMCGPLPGAGLPDERPRDDARHRVRRLQQVPGFAAGAVELLQRNDFLVRRHLEDAVRRGVHDPAPGAHMLGAELVEDGRAGGGPVPEDAAPGAPRKLLHDLVRESPGVGRERARASVRPHSSQCPVVESLPAPAGWQVPHAALGDSTWATPVSGAQHPRPSASSSGSVRPPTARRVLPRVSLPVSP